MPEHRRERTNVLRAPGIVFCLIGLGAGILAFSYSYLGLGVMSLFVAVAFGVLFFVRRPILLRVRQYSVSTLFAFKLLVWLGIGCALFIR